VIVPPAPPAVQQQEQVNHEPIKQVATTYPHSIYISEFLPNPKGADEAAEWIELYNDADSAANIGGFFLDDAAGASSPYQIPAGTAIGAKGFLVFNRAQTKIALNNTSDEVRLLYPDKSVAASIKYDGVKEGYAGAYDLQSHKLYWTAKPTPGQANVVSSRTQLASAKAANKTYQTSDLSSPKTDTTPHGDFNIASAPDAQNQLAASVPVQSQGSLPDFWLLAIALLVGAAGMFGYLKFFKNAKLMLVAALFLVLPVFAHAETFNVASDLEAKGNLQVEADAIKSTPHSIAYVQQGVLASRQAIDALIDEFENTTYPRLSAFLGDPWNPGINSDPRFSILFMKMSPGIGGYYDPENELPRSQYPASNERKIIFLSADYLSRYKIKEFLAHEFTHSITYNQKIRRLGKEEQVWLNELRSEYASSYLGYDENFKGSNLEERFRDFLRNPYDHLITWNNTPDDYAQVDMLGQYLAARFGPQFFSEEIKSDDVGIASVNKTLQTFDSTLTFAKFFSQWRLANFINDDSVLSGKYSYKNKNLAFTFAPELSMDLTPVTTSQTLTASVPTFSAKSIIIHTNGTRATLTFSTPNASSDLVVSFVKELQDGSLTDGQLVLNEGSAQLSVDKNTANVLALASNASQNIINTAVTLTGEVLTTRQPSIAYVEPVFVNPTPEHNTVIIKGQDFDPNVALYVNDQPQSVTYQDERTLIAKISLHDSIIRVKLVNPDNTQATFSFNNPIKAMQPSLVTTSPQATLPLPNGSLIRAQGDYNVYVINNGFKRHIVSPTIFSFYPTLNPAMITVLSSDALNAYPESVVIRAAGDQKVYELLANSTKRWIQTAQDFLNRGFDWKAIFEVNSRELNFYSTIL